MTVQNLKNSIFFWASLGPAIMAEAFGAGTYVPLHELSAVYTAVCTVESRLVSIGSQATGPMVIRLQMKYLSAPIS